MVSRFSRSGLRGESRIARYAGMDRGVTHILQDSAGAGTVPIRLLSRFL